MKALEREEEPSLMKARIQMERKWMILSKSGPCKAMLVDRRSISEGVTKGFSDVGSFEELIQQNRAIYRTQEISLKFPF